MAQEPEFTRSGAELVTVLFRDFDAPVWEVFEAWTTASLLQQWWGPHFTTIDICTFEARIGGRYRIDMGGEEDQRYPIYGIIRGYLEHECLVWQVCLDEHPESWRGIFRPRGTHLENAPAVWEYNFAFEAIPDGTRVTVTSTFPVEEDVLTMLAAGASVVWGESFEKLDDLLSKSQM